MANVIYTAEAHVTGGRTEGHGRTADGQLEVDLRVPKELGGEQEGTNPEELFAVGYAACFEGALGTVARRAKEEMGDVAIDSKVMLVTTEDRAFTVAVELDVTLPAIDDPAKAVELVAAAHKVCPYSNATRG
ncbi:MAG TPA: Ohr family peroxiredoxin, partial [Solirubrobacteraceae bacterium]|nr:Ohr family peroxiredoxin [Solirubrobacteraceae bacterium]